MDILIAFFIGVLCGGLVMAFANGCANNEAHMEGYKQGFLDGQNTPKHVNCRCSFPLAKEGDE